LRRQSSEPGARTDDDCVVSSKVVDLRNRSGLINLEVRVARDLVGYELGNAFDIDLRAGLSGPFGDGCRHRLDMAV
jgi:hypothetical protein